MEPNSFQKIFCCKKSLTAQYDPEKQPQQTNPEAKYMDTSMVGNPNDVTANTIKGETPEPKY
jgi:hypothetical protein